VAESDAVVNRSAQPRGQSGHTRIADLLGPATLGTATVVPLQYVFEAIELAKKFDDGQVQALRGVNFCVAQGEFLAITGPSGCGKSTLLQMLGALDRPTKGTLLYRGNSIPGLRDQSRYRALEIGFIFQAFHLLPTFTALENVQIPMFENQRPVSERRDRAITLLKSVGLGHRLDHFPAKLSGGERQRVAIARSLANGPSVLLADEPTGNLDSENARLVLELIIRVHREQNMTLVLVTHDMNIAQQATRTIQMKDGRIVSDRESTIAEP
jgi:ABC-type lipoprotein export system ATPase subunit